MKEKSAYQFSPALGMILAFLSLLLMEGTFGQDISFTAAAMKSVREGEQFRLTYTINAQGSQFRGPSISGLRVLSGPMSSTNQSYQIINGKVEQSYQQTYTYYLSASNKGTYEIPPATITVNGKEYRSNPLTIEVTEGTKPQASAQGQSRVNPQTGLSEDDVYIKAMVNKRNPYQGEEIIVTYRIYTTVPISQIGINKLSSFPGLWYKSLLEDNQSLNQRNETIDGKQYVVADLRKFALFPQRSGEINIEPMELECTAQVRTERSSRFRDPFFDNFFDDPFFNRNVKNVPLTLYSEELKLNIKPLPLEGKPSDFRGAVGRYELSSSIDKTDVRANDAITLKVNISGSGNLELVEPPNFTFPPDFEVYDPKVSNNIKKSHNGISGSRTFEYLLIPRNAGDFTIPPARFAYFDDKTEKYVTLSTPAYDISVEKGTESAGQVTYSGVSQKDVQYIGTDVRHIKSYPFNLMKIGTHFYRSDVFYILLVIPIVLFIVITVLWKSRMNRRQNIVMVRNRKANRVARKNLKQAKEFLSKNEEVKFYEEVSRALWGYLSNKFNIPLAGLSMDTVNENLRDKNVSEETVSEYTGVLSNCEYARFAPGSSSDRMNDIYSQALQIISKTEREIK